MTSRKCDMHVHSSASTTSARWILRALKAPESFTPPELVYEQARSRGMDFVTITDMNTIDGVMKINGLPGVFMSEEVAMVMPESKSMVHILVYGIDHQQHDRISALRERGFELLEYLRDQQIAHSLAHPFYSPGGHLPPGEWTDLVKAMELIEVRNGTRASWENSAALETAAAIKGRSFTGCTAGSDDHCGRFIGLTWTMVPKAKTTEDFLKAVRNGEGVPGGEHGTATRSAYAVYSIAYSFYRHSLNAKKVPSVATMAADSFFSPKTNTEEEEPTLWHKADFLFHQLLKKAKKSGEPDFETFLGDELVEIGRDLNLRRGSPELLQEGIEERTFQILNRLTNRLLQRFIGLMVTRFGEGRMLDAVGSLNAMLPVFLLNAPFPIAYLDRKRGRESVNTITKHLNIASPAAHNLEKRAWVTDTIDDLNGVSRTLQRFARLAMDNGKELALVTSQSRQISFPGWLVNFQPVTEFPVPDYASKTLAIPPILELLRFLEENEFGMIYISTPGPMGFAVIAAAKILGIPTVGIYHTDFPRHIREIVADAWMGEFAAGGMTWFYSMVDRVMVPSTYYMDDLASLGVDRKKMEPFPRGTDPETFSPKWRDEAFLTKFGGTKEATKLLYTGRVSREKDLDVLAEAFNIVRQTRQDIELFVVGDGPWMGELGSRILGNGGYLAGRMSGEDLSKAYASADIFVFPSTTDTYGNSVLEAQASGLPAIVTDMGGPQEIIRPNETGLTYHGRDAADLAQKIIELTDNEPARKAMAQKARQLGESKSWQAAFDQIWRSVPERW